MASTSETLRATISGRNATRVLSSAGDTIGSATDLAAVAAWSDVAHWACSAVVEAEGSAITSPVIRRSSRSAWRRSRTARDAGLLSARPFREAYLPLSDVA